MMVTTRIIRGAIDLSESFRILDEEAATFAKTVTMFNAAYQQIIEREYLHSHANLPGSSRTNRLRKKRRTRLGNWIDERAAQ